MRGSTPRFRFLWYETGSSAKTTQCGSGRFRRALSRPPLTPGHPRTSTYADIEDTLPAVSRINGIIDPPEEAHPKEVDARLELDSSGFETRVSINDRDHGSVGGGTLASGVHGCVEGPNTISIDARPHDGTRHESSVKVTIQDDSGNSRVVFEWTSDGQGAQSFEGVFEV